jgi:hypothetical protein
MSGIASVVGIAPTQSLTMNLITSIIREKEDLIRQSVSPEIRFTSIHNGGQPVEKTGVENYISGIKRIWAVMLEYRYSTTVYGKFTDTSGEFNFTQICKTQTDTGQQYMLSRGTQSFTFEGDVISAITVKEDDQFLTNEEFSTLMATITEQGSKLATKPASSVSSGILGGCKLM